MKKKVYTHTPTKIVTEKTKNIYPTIYFVYRGYNRAQCCSWIFALDQTCDATQWQVICSNIRFQTRASAQKGTNTHGQYYHLMYQNNSSLLLLLLCWCFTALRHFSGHFRHSHLTYLHCSWASLLGSLPVLSAHLFANNWQLPFLNQRKGENRSRNYFMTKLHERILSDLRIEMWPPAWLRVRIRPSYCALTLTFKI